MADTTLQILLPQVEKLRSSIANIYSLKQKNSSDDQVRNALTESALQITAMKSLSRKVYHLKNEHMQEVQVAKKRVEETSLRLQNLQYEKNQLLNEIRRSRAFRTTETDKVSLMTKDDYYKDTGTKKPKKITKEEEHKLYLERLAHELALRKRLAEELENLAEQTKKVDRTTSSKIKFLQDLKSKLKNVEDATLPLQNFFGDKVTQLNATHERATQLPAPLYTLYRQLDSFAQTFGHQKSAVASSSSSKGKNSKKKASLSTSSSSSSSSSTNSSKNKSTSSAANSSFENAYNETEQGIHVQLKIVAATPYPNGSITTLTSTSSLGKRDRTPAVYKDAVVATLTSSSNTTNGSNDGYVTIRFQYVPSVSKVTCVVVDSSVNNVSYNMLNELYCNDLSDSIVENNNNNTNEQEDSRATQEIYKNVGASYLWAQWLSGMYRLSVGGTTLSPNTLMTSGTSGDRAWRERRVRPSTSSLLHTIMTRRYRTSILMLQIQLMKKKIHPIPVPNQVQTLCFPKHRDPQACLIQFAVVQENNAGGTGGSTGGGGGNSGGSHGAGHSTGGMSKIEKLKCCKMCHSTSCNYR